jgi:archaellum biogenesis protein FlaJ (TadC family)
VLLALGLVLRWPMTIPWAVLLVGGGYLVAREGNAAVDGWAAVIGVLLLLSAELASWSMEHDGRIKSERALVLRRALTLGVLVAAALLVNFLLLATAGVSASAGVLLAAVGVAAAVGAVAVVLRLLRA